MATLVGYEVTGAVATVTLNRPEKLNAFTGAMLGELHAALEMAASDDGVHVVVLTGKGRAFSAGQDLTAFTPGETDLGEVLEREYRPLVMQLMAFPKVTVAALNGPAFGAAANLALACDVVVAGESAYLQQTFVKIGLIPDVGGTWLLPRIVGLKRALALTLTGDNVTAHEAQAMGLVYRVFADADFAAEAMALAERIAKLSVPACRLTKQGLGASLSNDMDQQLKIEANLQRQAGLTPEFRDAIAAFRTKH